MKKEYIHYFAIIQTLTQIYLT